MNTSQMVDDLMELERQPVRRMETRVETYGEQQETWRSMGRTLGQLRDASRQMYGFENPFRDRIASSSDESILTASATRQARESIEELTVLQTAGRDRFASRPVDRDFRVAPGRYEFSVGEERRTFRFGGGSLEDFSNAVNERLGTIVRTAVVPDTRETRVFVVEGLQEGSEAILGFGEDAAPLMEEIGVLAPARADRQVSLLSDSPLRLEPGATDELRLDAPFPIESGMVLRFEARTEEIPREAWSPPPVPPGPDVPVPGSVTLEGITIEDEAVPLALPEQESPEPPPLVEDNRAVVLNGPGGTRTELPPLPETATFQTVEIPADRLIATASSFAFQNLNTDRALEVRNIQILDPTTRGGGSPRNVLDSARDARIRYNGIEIVRGSNEIDDLIPGVTLNLRRPSDVPVEVDVQPNREAAKDSIIEMVGYYNQVIRDINIYTRSEPALIDQIDYFDAAEREVMESRLGIFQGDSSLNQLRTRMQTIMMNAYGDGGRDSYALLAQIGISTNASGAGGGVDTARLRGYLEINESQLDDALSRDFEAVGRLFGQDTDGDLAVDRGVAVALEQFVSPYVRTGGIVASRSDSLNSQIDQTEGRISRYNDRLEDYEQQLRREFGQMEGMLQQMEESSTALDRLNSQSNQNN
jgi:flagellar hook-associated protein 2